MSKLKVRNIFLEIEYDGTEYCGWQTQKKNLPTIQSTLQRALNKITGEEIVLTSAGRTDSGVHAIAQSANFKTSSRLSKANLLKALNTILPKDIRIKKVKEVDIDFNCRYDAVFKVYVYRIFCGECLSAFQFKYCWHIPRSLDIESMRKAAKYLVGKYDFSAFQSIHKSAKTSPVRTVREIFIKKKGKWIEITTVADSFLYKMVRNIVGYLVEVGKGRYLPSYTKTILARKKRIYIATTAPARGLFLKKVAYPVGRFY